MPTSASRNELLFEEAAEWVVELRESGVRGEAAARLMEWLRRSPEHVAAYFEMAALWEDVPRLMPRDRIDVDALVVSARAEPEVIAFAAPSSQQRPARATFRPAVWAASLVVCIGLVLAVWLQLRPQTYVTGTGEQRSVTLDDGSVIALDTQSRVRVRFASDARKVELLEGQALFRVSRDDRRPFVVSCDDTRVRAVGTAFNVYRKTSGTKLVAVVEGHVAMLPGTGRSEVLLGPGDQVAVTAGSVTRTESADVTTATAWTQRNLVFHGTALSEVVAELNRYNRKQLILDDASLQAVRINGVFSSTNPASLLRFLREQPGITVWENDAAIHISRGKVE